MMIRRMVNCAFVAGLITLIGCEGGPKLAEVEGTVKLKGNTLDKIQVEFWPIGSGPRSFGVTDAKGRFTLTSDGKRNGAVVGAHKVVLRDVGILGDKFLGRAGETVDMAKGKKSRISEDLSDPQKTPFTREVATGKNTIELELSKP